MGGGCDELDDQLILNAIRNGCLAGSYGYWALREPAAAAGLERLRRKHSAAASQLLTEYLARAASDGSGPSCVEDE